MATLAHQCHFLDRFRISARTFAPPVFRGRFGFARSERQLPGLILFLVGGDIVDLVARMKVVKLRLSLTGKAGLGWVEIGRLILKGIAGKDTSGLYARVKRFGSQCIKLLI